MDFPYPYKVANYGEGSETQRRRPMQNPDLRMLEVGVGVDPIPAIAGRCKVRYRHGRVLRKQADLERELR